ncbi:rhodanese-like domain-containing protein [Liquorilactobacillus vini]|uniref:Rhodanese domain-containing protein n=1 Tax=Liquorilactobacillus vini DSM 20605 TaxID=1133569 RepID=A0A0R2C5X7_9LACO|nr:rhodanese-like domain-containing protein [Liquorilactobacillus vini]KRM86322.1 hypothetical protein FD21_GL001655 [Liquorilactobacillus vini DSM 20605]
MFWDKFESVSTDELNNKMNRQTAIMDVRQPYEYQEGHIPGAVNYPLMQVLQDPQAALKQVSGRPLYVICHSGARSRQATKALSRYDQQVINVSGGMMNWHGKVKQGAKK